MSIAQYFLRHFEQVSTDGEYLHQGEFNQWQDRLWKACQGYYYPLGRDSNDSTIEFIFADNSSLIVCNPKQANYGGYTYETSYI